MGFDKKEDQQMDGMVLQCRTLGSVKAQLEPVHP